MKIQTEFRIDGMSCMSCRDRIEKKLKCTGGIEDAAIDFGANTASVTHDPSVITAKEIAAVIESLGYRAFEGGPAEGGKSRIPMSRIAGTLAIIVLLYMLVRSFGAGVLGAAFPMPDEGTRLGLLFVIGLVTSLHCTAMCGGINLSQTLGAGSGASPGLSWGLLLPALLYNAGRVLSYTAIGVIAGALGQAVTVSGRFQGIVQIIAGIFMVIMGVNMLGLFPALRSLSPRLPGFLSKRLEGERNSGRGPFFIGLLNGLMPCGPLQAMQIYALSTGSPIRGGLSMFLFSLGTVPLMFGLGALGSFLSGVRGRAFSRRVMNAGAVLVTVMGLTMFSYGFNLSGLNFDFAGKAAASINPLAAGSGFPAGESAFTPVIENGVQIVNSTLSSGRYPAITVQQGIPVRWTINAPEGSINGCNNRAIIREYQIEHRFRPGENVIEFTPGRPGRFTYSCWMGMIRSTITVVEKGAAAPESASGPDTNPVPAGVSIPVETIALAEIQDARQRVRIDLRDDGMEPAVIVVQRGVPAEWIINNDSLDPGNSGLIFPAYYLKIDIQQGENLIRILPEADFDFSTADNVFYGYVKVVEDLSVVNPETVKKEVLEFEPLIYPDAWFEAANQGMGCCGPGGR